MKWLKYLFATAIISSWAILLFLEFTRPISERWLVTGLGWILAAMTLGLAAAVARQWNAFRKIVLLLAGFIMGEYAAFAYRLNNICGPGDHIIQSEAEAIKQAQIRIIRAR